MKKVFLFAIAALMSASMFAENITVAKAIEIGEKLADNAETTESYVVEGYVTKWYGAYSDEYGSLSFYLDDSEEWESDTKFNCEAFQCKVAKPLMPGTKVTVNANIKKYVNGSNKTINLTNGEATIVSEPTLEEVSVSDAKAIAEKLPAKEVGETSYTAKVYRVVGVHTGYYTSSSDDGTWKEKYKNESFFMADEVGESSGFVAYRAATGVSIEEGAGVAVVGKIRKSVYKNSKGEVKTGYQISYGVAEPYSPSAINNVNAENVKAMKVIENGQLFIIRNGVKFNAAGAVVK